MGSINWDKAFVDAKYLSIMYYLAKYNPSIAAVKIAKKFDMKPDDVQRRLKTLENLRIVEEKNHKYTLTDKGLMSLYNFHVNYNK